VSKAIGRAPKVLPGVVRAEGVRALGRCTLDCCAKIPKWPAPYNSPLSSSVILEPRVSGRSQNVECAGHSQCQRPHHSEESGYFPNQERLGRA
jgi:hypothetical protein